MSSGRPQRAPYWPDRSAHRRRRSARRMFWVAALLVVVLPWFGYRHVRDWVGPEVDEAVPASAVPASDAAAAGDTRAGPSPDSSGAQPHTLPPGTQSASPGTQPQASPSSGAQADSLIAAPAAASPDAEAAAEAQVDAIGREARAGDGEAAAARLEGLGAQLHREVLLADRGSAVRREAARRDVAAIGGVRAAGWIDRMTMLLLVSGRGQAHTAISEACRRLSAHGDVAGLAVRVQEVGGDGSHAAALVGECTQARSRAAAHAEGPFPGVSLRGQAASVGPDASPEDAAAAAERERREAESLRILSESTPELPALRKPGPTPDAH